MHVSGSSELPRAKSGSGEPKMHDSSSPEYEPGLTPENQKCIISGHRSCQEPGLAPLTQIYNFGSPVLPRAKFGSGDPKMNDSGSPEYEPGLAPVNQKCMIREPKCVIPLYRSCHEPVLATVNPNCVISVQRSCPELGLAPVKPNA